MKEILKNKKILIPIATIILAVIILGVSYAYFRANVTENNKTESVIQTKELKIAFDGTQEIEANSITPGWSAEKKFTVENLTNSKTAFNIYMQNIPNEFDNELTYSLYETDSTGTIIETLVDGEVLPQTNAGKSYLQSDIELNPQPTKKYYTIKIEFAYKDTPQNEYQGAHFRAIVGIDAAEIVREEPTPESGESTSSTIGMRSDSYHPEQCTAPTLNLGDYVTIVPTESRYVVKKSLTGYDDDQIISPKELTLWRVIKVNDCNVEVISEYTSSNKISFIGTNGYANFVGVLNSIAHAYENPTYTVGSRMVGYDGQTEFIKDTSGFDGSSNKAPGNSVTPDITSGVGEEYDNGVQGDTLYVNDYQLLSNVYGSGGLTGYSVNYLEAQGYWLASRWYYSFDSNSAGFNGRNIHSEYGLASEIIRSLSSGTWSDDSTGNNAVRPILILKTGIQTNGGSGSSYDPYTLS